MPKREVEFVVTVWKEIWHARNKFIFEGRKLSPVTLIAKAKATIEAYQRVHETEQINRRDGVSKQKQWCPPPIGYYKVNVDAAVQAGAQLTGIRVVIRNSQGQVVATVAVKNTKPQENVSAAEAEAVKRGMEMAIEAGLSAVIIETDCMEVVNLANNITSSRKEILWAISDIQSYMEKFQSITIQHVSRCCNSCAQSLAERALRSSESVTWKDNFPPDVLSYLE